MRCTAYLHCVCNESAAKLQCLRPQQVQISLNEAAIHTEIKAGSCLLSEDLRYAGLSSKIPSPPLPTLKWGLGRGGSWLRLFQSFGCTACTWAPLGWPCLPTGCSVAVSSHDLAFLLQTPTNRFSWIGKKTQTCKYIFRISDGLPFLLLNCRLKLNTWNYLYVFWDKVMHFNPHLY